ncbi:hypothetical protein NP233_g9479 [Leucocoprinus birnbaumii]|uniref:Major facilitator superfamily (MFS) profile domain-containing protein n=1 Tax=Leucocoprinus birnbaumii TaxID=56174 RepID=A0AAD5VQU8_9AGAR|nr:hypothetical protein NP233_g9479 [Leucocoprinus birnbaumii]
MNSEAGLAFVVYWGIVLFGYDTGIGGGVVSNPYFQQHFGVSGNQKKIDAVSSNVVAVLQAGAFFGAIGSAPISARIGRRWTLEFFTLIFCLGAILQTIASGPPHGLGLIYGGRVVAGVGIGGISSVAPAFVSECSPKDVRGRITGLFQIMVRSYSYDESTPNLIRYTTKVAIGVMISYFVNFGISAHISTGVLIWRIPFAIQLVPGGIMALGILTIKESPRWLASVGRNEEALKNLAYLRKEPETSPDVLHEMAEIEAAIIEEREVRKGLGWKEAFFGKGNFVRFFIAFFIFLLQQWAGQNSVNYYAPQIFQAIGYEGTKAPLLASGIYGVVKVVATAIFIFWGVETLGRKLSLFISAMGMGILFYIIGALLKTHPPPPVVNGQPPSSPPPASQAMAGLLYIYVVFYSMGWGPLPWVYVADIFPTRTRHYGLAVASASQWLWNFVVSKVTPQMKTNLGYKIFIMFATVNVGAMATFSLLIPETKNRSLEEMDVIFGAVSAEERQAYINKVENEGVHGAVEHADNSSNSVRSDSVERKV